MPENWISTAAAILFAFTGVSIAVFAFARCRGLTFIGPCLWAAATSLAASALAVSSSMGTVSQSTQSVLYYVAGVGLLLPMVSLLGAKRPQDKAWHVIVASLWIVLVLPVAESYLIRPGSDLQIHGIWGWFLWILILTGWANHVGTRYFLPVTLWAAAEVSLLLPHLPLGAFARVPQPLWAASLLLAAELLVVRSVLEPRRRDGLEQVWFDFRDTYGVVWGLRVAERINATAQSSEWPVRLTWNGFGWQTDDENRDHRSSLTRVVRSLLRRFVSDEWLDQRLDAKRDDGASGPHDHSHDDGAG